MSDLSKDCSKVTVDMIQHIKNNPETVTTMNNFLQKYELSIRNSLTRHCLRMVYNHSDAEELVNDVLVILHKKVHEVQKDCKFNRLVKKVIKGVFLNYLQKKKSGKRKILKSSIFVVQEGKEINLMDVLLDDSAKADEVFDLILVRTLIEQMPKIDIEIYQYRYSEGLSLENISKKLGITRHKVESTLNKITALVKEYYGEQ